MANVPTTSVYLGESLWKRMRASKIPMNASEVSRIAIEFSINWLEKRKKSHAKESDRQRVKVLELELMRRLNGG